MESFYWFLFVKSTRQTLKWEYFRFPVKEKAKSDLGVGKRRRKENKGISKNKQRKFLRINHSWLGGKLPPNENQQRKYQQKYSSWMITGTLMSSANWIPRPKLFNEGKLPHIFPRQISSSYNAPPFERREKLLNFN